MDYVSTTQTTEEDIIRARKVLCDILETIRRNRHDWQHTYRMDAAMRSHLQDIRLVASYIRTDIQNIKDTVEGPDGHS